MAKYKYKCEEGKLSRDKCASGHMERKMRLVPGQDEPVVMYMFTYTDEHNVLCYTGPSPHKGDIAHDRSGIIADGFLCSRVQTIVLDPPPRRKGK